MVRPVSTTLQRTLSNVFAPVPFRIAFESPQLKHMGVYNNTVAPLKRYFHAGHDLQQAGRPHLSYALSASYSAKRRRLDPERNLYNFDHFVRVKKTATELRDGKQDRSARPASGQDAFFISTVGETQSIAFGVVDGVGGWEDSGVDPADFAHGICDYMASAARSFPQDFNTTSEARPVEVLTLGYDKVQGDKSIEAGGSTACIAVADPDGRLEVANLGDSGFVHLGLNAVRYLSQPQTHAFNTPFQMAKLPKKMLAQMALFQGGAKPFSEHPTDSATTHHQLRHGDILVFATDGVWDNLSASDILDIVARQMEKMGAWTEGPNGLELSGNLKGLLKNEGDSRSTASLTASLALTITKEAKEASLSSTRDGPFAKEVQRLYPAENWHGGKADDICVVVLIAVEESGMIRAKL